jgi:hypothetical protein
VERVGWAACRKGGEDLRRCTMDVSLTGTEIHALRGLVEEAIIKLDKEVKEGIEPKTASALKESRDVFKDLLEKLPVEFGTVS